jgi:hypothetical protein
MPGRTREPVEARRAVSNLHRIFPGASKSLNGFFCGPRDHVYARLGHSPLPIPIERLFAANDGSIV